MELIKGTNQRAIYDKIRNEKGYIEFNHRYIWRMYNGKIPEGFLIHHKNGNKKDNHITNLELVSREEHALLHRKPNRIRKVSSKGIIKVIKIKFDELNLDLNLQSKITAFLKM